MWGSKLHPSSIQGCKWRTKRWQKPWFPLGGESPWWASCAQMPAPELAQSLISITAAQSSLSQLILRHLELWRWHLVQSGFPQSLDTCLLHILLTAPSSRLRRTNHMSLLPSSLQPHSPWLDKEREVSHAMWDLAWKVKVTWGKKNYWIRSRWWNTQNVTSINPSLPQHHISHALSSILVPHSFPFFCLLDNVSWLGCPIVSKLLDTLA